MMENLVPMAEMVIKENKGQLVHKDQGVYLVNEVSMGLMDGKAPQVIMVHQEKQVPEEQLD